MKQISLDRRHKSAAGGEKISRGPHRAAATMRRLTLVGSLVGASLGVGSPARADHISFASPPFSCNSTSIHMWAPQFASAGFSDSLVMWMPEVVMWDQVHGWQHYAYGDFAYQSLWGQGFSQWIYLDGSGVASEQTLPGLPAARYLAVHDWVFFEDHWDATWSYNERNVLHPEIDGPYWCTTQE
jgi:hypothetical protein